MNAKQLAQIVALVVQAVEASKKPNHKPISSYKPANKNQHIKAKSDKVLSEGKTERQLRNEAAVGKAFAKQGIHVTPRSDVFTYKEWEKRGFRPVPKSKGTFVKGVGTLFHSGQVSTFAQPSKAEMRAETASVEQVGVVQ